MSRTLSSLIAIAAGAACALAASATLAQGITTDQANQILNELKQIRQALERQPVAAAAVAPPAPNDKVSIAFPGGGYAVGRSDAPLTLVEYTDYQCPFCQQFHNTSFAQIKANYIDTGKVRYVSRDFPLPFHENARRAAMAARCAGDQGKFWELRHAMIVNADQLKAEQIATYAGNVQLDVPAFRACAESDKYKAAIDKDIAEGTAAGIGGTPSFVIGTLDKDRLDGVRLVGALPYPQFEAKIKEMLEKSGKKN